MPNQCLNSTCKKTPAYGVINTKTALFCAEHKESDMVNVKSKKCQYPACKKIPVFGTAGTKVAIYCAEHKESDMVNIVGKTCQHPACKTRPSYDITGAKTALFCAKHKKSDMVDVKGKTCLHPACKSRPAYGITDTKIALYCAEHKELNMVNVRHKTCQHPACKKIPVFGTAGTKVAIYCAEHKEINMTDVKHKTCQHPACKKIPAYGIINTTTSLYCVEHKEPTMVNIRSKICQYPACKTQASYGLPGNEKERCKEHILDGMIIHPRKRCESCPELGIWGISSTSEKRHCDVHKQASDKNLIEGNCTNCGLKAVLDRDKICQSCGEFGAIKRQYLEKQKAVKTALQKAEIAVESYDQILDSGVCSKKRPDFVINGLYRKIVVEVDEFQHTRGYGPDCEFRRMWDITQAIGMPTTFIRFNPDRWRDKDKKIHNDALFTRCRVLVNWINSLIPRETDENFANVLYLYYDGFISQDKCSLEPLAPII
jgi:translation initiation factor IF-3